MEDEIVQICSEWGFPLTPEIYRSVAGLIEGVCFEPAELSLDPATGKVIVDTANLVIHTDSTETAIQACEAAYGTVGHFTNIGKVCQSLVGSGTDFSLQSPNNVLEVVLTDPSGVTHLSRSNEIMQAIVVALEAHSDLPGVGEYLQTLGIILTVLTAGGGVGYWIYLKNSETFARLKSKLLANQKK